MLQLEVRTPITIQQKMTWKERGVYSALKEFMSWNEYNCYPSVNTLAEILDCSTNTVRKYLRSLEKKGIISIEYRVEKHKKSKNKYNKTNLYTFIAEKMLKPSRVLQKDKKPTQQQADEQVLSNKLNDMYDSPEIIKVELTEKYGQVVVERALQVLSIVTSKGTVVNNLKNYLDKVCRGIQAQLSIVQGLGQVDGDKSSKSTVGQKKSPKSNLKGGWGSSSINTDSRSSNYTNNQLESKMLEKRLKYSL